VATAIYRGIAEINLFARSAVRYWLKVFPQACRELKHWHRRAAEIPDDALRAAALEALLVKRGDLEGAVAFAAFTPETVRLKLIRGIAAWEIAFDYLDTIGEMPNPDPIANGQALNQALITALVPGSVHSDYYALHMRQGDAGYLAELVDACRNAVTSLPAYDRIVTPTQRVLSRIVAYQSLNHGDSRGSHTAFAEWARSQTAPEANLNWWETAAAAGSQLTVLALMTAAADPALTPQQVCAVEGAYFPWIGALSTLLDSLIDQPRDAAERQPNLIDHYGSPREVAERLGEIASEALRRVRALPNADRHVLLLAAMAAFFHTRARSRDARLATRRVLEALGPQASPALCIFKMRAALAWTVKAAWSATRRTPSLK
jgi:tetraprenyl-beta-curcumene synthase